MGLVLKLHLMANYEADDPFDWHKSTMDEFLKTYPPAAIAEEAAFSRQYGGIHYRFDSVNGLTAGHTLGRWILNNIRLTVLEP